MSDPRRNHPSSSRASTASGSRREASSASTTPPVGEALRALPSLRTSLHLSTAPHTRTDRVSSSPVLQSSVHQPRHHPVQTQSPQQVQQASAVDPSHYRLQDLVNTAVTHQSTPAERGHAPYDDDNYSPVYQQGAPRRPSHDSSFHVRESRPEPYRYTSPSTRRYSPYERSESSTSSPGQSPSDGFLSQQPHFQPGAASAARSMGRRSAQFLRPSSAFEGESQSDLPSSSVSTSAHSGPLTSASSGSSGRNWQYAKSQLVGHPGATSSTQAPPPGSTSSTATLQAFRHEVKEDVEMGGDDDDGHTLAPYTGRGRPLSVQYPTSSLRGTPDPGPGRRGGRRANRFHMPPVEQASERADARTMHIVRTPDRRGSASAEAGEDSLRDYGTPSVTRDLYDDSGEIIDFVSDSRYWNLPASANTPPRQGETPLPSYDQQGPRSHPSSYSNQQTLFLSPRQQYRVTPPARGQPSSVTPPPPSPSEHDDGHAFERSSVRSIPSRPRTLVGPGVPSSPLSPTAPRPQSLQELGTFRERGIGASADFAPPPETSMAGRSARSGTAVAEIAVPQPGYPIQPPRIETNAPSNELTTAIAVAVVQTQERDRIAAGSSTLPANRNISSNSAGDVRPEPGQRTSLKRLKSTPKDEDEEKEPVGKDRAAKGKGDSPNRKPRASASRKRSGDNVEGQGQASSSGSQAIHRQIQRLSIDIPSSYTSSPQGGSALRSPVPNLSPSQSRISPRANVGQFNAREASSSATPGEPSTSRSADSQAGSNFGDRPGDDDVMDEDTDDGEFPEGKKAKSKGKGKGKGKAAAKWDGDDKEYEFSIGDTPPGGEREKREKISIACTFCRTRKIKCDGSRPSCTRCLSRNDGGTCEYAVEPKRRGRGKKTKEREAREQAARERAKAARPKKELKRNMPEAGTSTNATEPTSMSMSTTSTLPTLTIRLPPIVEGQSSSSSSVRQSSASAPPSAGPGPSNIAHRMRTDLGLPPIQTSRPTPPPSHQIDPALYALSLPMPAPAPSPVTSLPPLSDIAAFMHARPPSAAATSHRHTPVPALSPLEAPGAPAWLRAPDEQFQFNVLLPPTAPSFGGVAGTSSRSSVGPSGAIVTEPVAGSKRDDEYDEFSSGDEYPGTDKRLKKRRKRHGTSSEARRQSDGHDRPSPHAHPSHP